MSDFLDDGFIENVVITDAETEDGKLTSLPRQDYERYRRFLSQVPVGKQARLTVPTGEIIPEFKTDKYGELVRDEQGRAVMNVNRGRGKTEMEVQRAFRTIANQEYNLGIDVRTENLPNGTTVMRVAMHPKRTFTDEQNAKRDAARKQGLIRRTEQKVAKATEALRADPQNVKLQGDLKQAQEALAKHRGLTAVPDQGPATGQKPTPQAKTGTK